MKESASMTSSSPSKTWSETRSGRIVILVGLLGLFVLVFWMAMKSWRMLATPAALVVDEQHLAFGEVWEDPAFIWTLPIHNTSNQDIMIGGFATTCSCAKIEPSSLTIRAQGTAEVRLTLNLLSAHSEPDLTAKDFEVAVQPWINKGVGTQAGWVVQGKVKKPFAIDPPVVDFEESLVRGQPFAPRSAVITCGQDVAELTAHCNSPFVTAKVTRDAKNPRRFRLAIQAREKIPGGPFNLLVRLAAVIPNKKEVPGMVPVVGRVLEDVSLQPELLAFGEETVGSRLQETVTLQSRSGKDFAIQEIDKGGASDITANLGLKRKDGSESFVVAFPVKRLGHQEYTIHVKVKTLQGLLELPLRMNCYGIPAQPAPMTK
jgi:hypothetical protein